MDQVLSSMSHGLRRRIIAVLAGSGSLSYSDLLRNTGVESSMLSFHLRKLRGLVERGDDGLYRLTSLGRRAASILECIQGSRSDAGVAIRGVSIYVIGDDVLLDAYKRGGLIVEGVDVLVILDASRNLLSRSLRGIRRVLAVYTPLRLLEVVESRIIDVDVVIPYKGRLPIPVDKPVEIIDDLRRRGYIRIAEKLRASLGSS